MNGISIKPEAEFKVGALRASVWSNPRQGRDGSTFNSHKVIVERTYKDMHGNFKNTPSLDVNDIPKAILALKKTYEYLMVSKPQARSEVPDEAYAITPPNRIP